MECVYCAVRTRCLNIIQVVSVYGSHRTARCEPTAPPVDVGHTQWHSSTATRHSHSKGPGRSKALHKKLTIAQLVSPLRLLEPKDDLPGHKNRPLIPSWSRPQPTPLSHPLSLSRCPAATTQFPSLAVCSRWISNKFQFQHITVVVSQIPRGMNSSRPNLILWSHLCLDLPSGPFLPNFRLKVYFSYRSAAPISALTSWYFVHSTNKFIIIINMKDWILWSVPPPESQLFAPTLLRSSNCSPSLWFVVG